MDLTGGQAGRHQQEHQEASHLLELSAIATGLRSMRTVMFTPRYLAGQGDVKLAGHQERLNSQVTGSGDP